MEKNARLFEHEDGRIAVLSQKANGDWTLRTEGEGDLVRNEVEPLLEEIHKGHFTEVISSSPLEDEMEALTDDYAKIKKMIWRLEGTTKAIKAKTGNSQEEATSALYASLNTVLGRMKIIIKALW